MTAISSKSRDLDVVDGQIVENAHSTEFKGEPTLVRYPSHAIVTANTKSLKLDNQEIDYPIQVIPVGDGLAHIPLLIRAGRENDYVPSVDEPQRKPEAFFNTVSISFNTFINDIVQLVAETVVEENGPARVTTKYLGTCGRWVTRVSAYHRSAAVRIQHNMKVPIPGPTQTMGIVFNGNFTTAETNQGVVTEIYNTGRTVQPWDGWLAADGLFISLRHPDIIPRGFKIAGGKLYLYMHFTNGVRDRAGDTAYGVIGQNRYQEQGDLDYREPDSYVTATTIDPTITAETSIDGNNPVAVQAYPFDGISSTFDLLVVQYADVNGLESPDFPGWNKAHQECPLAVLTSGDMKYDPEYIPQLEAKCKLDMVSLNASKIKRGQYNYGDYPHNEASLSRYVNNNHYDHAGTILFNILWSNSDKDLIAKGLELVPVVRDVTFYYPNSSAHCHTFPLLNQEARSFSHYYYPNCLKLNWQVFGCRISKEKFESHDPVATITANVGSMGFDREAKNTLVQARDWVDYMESLGQLPIYPMQNQYFGDGVSVGNFPTLSAPWNEISDITASLKPENLGWAWVIADEGYNPVVMRAIRLSNAADGGVWTLTAEVGADVEAIGTFIKAGQAYLIVGDIGDNSAARTTVNLYRIKEPTITGSPGSLTNGVDYEKIVINYPASPAGEGGTARRDAETILCDPDTGDVYILTKRTTQVQVFKLAYAASYTGTQTLVSLGNMYQIPFSNQAAGAANGGRAVGGCISPDGAEIFVKNYTTVYRFPREKSTQTIYQALSATPQVIDGYVGGGQPSSHPNSEPQGEGITLGPVGRDLYTASEYNATFDSGMTSYPLFKYPRLTRPYTTATFQDGLNSYAGTRDTYLYSLAAQAAATRGAETSFVVDYNADAPTDKRYGLLKFDLSSIPANCTVVGVDLVLNTMVEGSFLRIHKMLEAWDENTTYITLGHLPAFDNVQAATNYSAVVGDYTGLTGPITIKLPPADVQAWLNGQTNNGWVMVNRKADDTTDGNGFQFTSREGATQSLRPKLVIRYQLNSINDAALDTLQAQIEAVKLENSGAGELWDDRCFSQAYALQQSKIVAWEDIAAIYLAILQNDFQRMFPLLYRYPIDTPTPKILGPVGEFWIARRLPYIRAKMKELGIKNFPAHFETDYPVIPTNAPHTSFGNEVVFTKTAAALPITFYMHEVEMDHDMGPGRVRVKFPNGTVSDIQTVFPFYDGSKFQEPYIIRPSGRGGWVGKYNLVGPPGQYSLIFNSGEGSVWGNITGLKEYVVVGAGAICLDFEGYWKDNTTGLTYYTRNGVIDGQPFTLVTKHALGWWTFQRAGKFAIKKEWLP